MLLLDFEHRAVGCADERSGVRGGGSRIGDADARGTVHGDTAADVYRGAQRVVDPLDETLDRGVVCAFVDNDEFVAAVTGDDIRVAYSCLEPGCRGAEHGVTCVVAVGVVDRFESVEVDEGDRERCAGTVGAAEGPAEEFVEEAPVGEAR